MKRLAVFDLDGTLVNSRASIAAALEGAWTALGLEPPAYDQSRRIVGLSLDDALRTLAPGLDPARYTELAEAYRQAFIRNRETGADEPLFEGAHETLRALKREGWKLGVATGKSRKGIDHIVRRHGLGGVFDAAFCADDGPGKPDPHMLRLNMRALDAGPASTVMIGDTSFDMAMARAADCYALGVTWGFHTREEVESGGAHEIVEAFADMAPRLTCWRGGSA